MNTDIVLCINANPSMQKFLNFFREHENELSDELERACGEVRVRVVEYGDYCTDYADAVLCSDFFRLPKQKEDFFSAVNAISYYDKQGNYRGGDIPDNAMEALFYAFKSDFTARRIRVALFTDAPALRLFERQNFEGYPKEIMAHTITELCEGWSNRKENKRLALFVPDDTDEQQLVQPWAEVVQQAEAEWYKQPAAFGLDELTVADIVDALK